MATIATKDQLESLLAKKLYRDVQKIADIIKKRKVLNYVSFDLEALNDAWGIYIPNRDYAKVKSIVIAYHDEIMKHYEINGNEKLATELGQLSFDAKEIIEVLAD